MKYLGGDYGPRGRSRLEKTLFTGRLKRIVVSGRVFRRWKIKAEEIVELREVNESNKVNLTRAIGGGAIGKLLAGPIGLLAGALLGGRGKKYVVFIRDRRNRKLLCAVSQREFETLLAATMDRSRG